MAKDISQMSAVELWDAAAVALREGRLRDAKTLLDEIGLRYDDAYSRLEEAVAAEAVAEKGTVWS